MSQSPQEVSREVDFVHLQSCLDLSEDDFARCAATWQTACELLDHLERICEAHTGEERVLHFLAHCARQPCLEGHVRLDVRPLSMFECEIVLLCGRDAGSLEQLRCLRLGASFIKLRQVSDTPEQVLPFELTLAEPEKLVLDATAEARRSRALGRARLLATDPDPAPGFDRREAPTGSQQVGRIRLEKRCVTRSLRSDSRPDSEGEEPREHLPWPMDIVETSEPRSESLDARAEPDEMLVSHARSNADDDAPVATLDNEHHVVAEQPAGHERPSVVRPDAPGDGPQLTGREVALGDDTDLGSEP